MLAGPIDLAALMRRRMIRGGLDLRPRWLWRPISGQGGGKRKGPHFLCARLDQRIRCCLKRTPRREDIIHKPNDGCFGQVSSDAKCAAYVPSSCFADEACLGAS